MYQALYRKYRPTVFSDVVGQTHITRTLRKQVAESHTSHAYLFTGSRGTGKTTCAKILSRAVNCDNPQNGDPCGKCAACVALESGSSLDVLELDAASNNGVDQVRALRDEAAYPPANVRKRVYIVDEVHMLSTSAFNALLKILEEPPEHLMFILATTELHKVPATILSRCQRYAFRRIQPRDIAERLRYVAQREEIRLTDDGAELLARLAEGAMRDGLSLLDQCAASGAVVDSATVLDTLGLAGNLQTARLLEYVLMRDVPSAMALFGELYDNGRDGATILRELSALIRDLLLQRMAPDGSAALLSGGYDAPTLEHLQAMSTDERLLYLASALQGAGAGLSDGANARLDAELYLLRLCDETLSGDLTALVSRIERLETGCSAAPPVMPPSEQPAPVTPPVRVTQASAPDGPQWDALPPMPDDTPSGDAEAAVPPSVDWNALLEKCWELLPPMYRPFLNRCEGTTFSNGTLTLYAPDSVTTGRLNNERVRNALLELSGAERVIVREGAPPPVAVTPELQRQNRDALIAKCRQWPDIVTIITADTPTKDACSDWFRSHEEAERATHDARNA